MSLSESDVVEAGSIAVPLPAGEVETLAFGYAITGLAGSGELAFEAFVERPTKVRVMFDIVSISHPNSSASFSLEQFLKNLRLDRVSGSMNVSTNCHGSTVVKAIHILIIWLIHLME